MDRNKFTEFLRTKSFDLDIDCDDGECLLICSEEYNEDGEYIKRQDVIDFIEELMKEKQNDL